MFDLQTSLKLNLTIWLALESNLARSTVAIAMKATSIVEVFLCRFRADRLLENIGLSCHILSISPAEFLSISILLRTSLKTRSYGFLSVVTPLHFDQSLQIR